MSAGRSADYLKGLVHELCKLHRETEWVEFKENNSDPHKIGEYISALANAAALEERPFAYVVWGVRDTDHQIIGTDFDPSSAKIGNEELESWLLRLLEPRLHFHFYTVRIDQHRVVLLEIARAQRQPARFDGAEFIRVGSYKKKLLSFPEKERALWRMFDQTPFEAAVARENVTDDEALALLAYPSYFKLMRMPLPEHKAAILSALEDDELIRANGAGAWHITNLGAVLFARRLSDFARLGRKAVRIVQYEGPSRVKARQEHVEEGGYAAAFDSLIAGIVRFVPTSEVIGPAFRKDVPMYPDLAVRELVGNALIHQDLYIIGAGPMIEIFSNRMEITNPGKPLVATERFVDAPPRSRNEAIASLLRRMSICEERGTGVDKIVLQTELHRMPAPLFEVPGDSTRGVLFAPRPLTQMQPEERIRACYLHACLRYVNREHLTNTSLRERFGVSAHNSAIVSRLIKEAIEAGKIVPLDETAAKKLMRYIPWWAAGQA
jgi:ATP-dependent DNA helicase RecG